ncbi:hypothetical protein M7I_7157 [Glarea lozoyensis 74030]|uniref:Uncharacterized protein n=1 Tax=Glarea lozoyensis (strain ATCC 74030 / MF5533) TaxID=1104152 RepID=H0EWJ0_GLAL7|nr:hypothetical protein M7I_7157 [Glarea lozoyensis 74030]
MRLCSHIDPTKLNTWMGFCLYVAGGVNRRDTVSMFVSKEE